MEEYDSSKDKVVGKVRIVALGERRAVIALRSLDGEAPRVAVLKTFAAKPGNRLTEDGPRWVVKDDGTCKLTETIKAGDLVLGGNLGRLEPAAAALVYGEAAAFAAALSSSSPAPKKKGKGKKDRTDEE